MNIDKLRQQAIADGLAASKNREDIIEEALNDVRIVLRELLGVVDNPDRVRQVIHTLGALDDGRSQDAKSIALLGAAVLLLCEVIEIEEDR